MKLREGYKQTEVGVIPRDWNVDSIQNLIDSQIITGHLDGNHGELYPKSNEFKANGVPYIGANDFVDGMVSFKRCKFLSPERAKIFRKGVAKDQDVLFAHNATVGPVALLKTTEDFVILSTTATYFRCNADKLDNQYLFYALQAPAFVSQYQAVMAQSTRFQVPITTQRKLRLVLAPVTEQRAISTALSDVDALLSKIDQLIAKKRDLKQANMQKLLTGHIRLQGFSGEWMPMKLADLCEYVPGIRSLDGNVGYIEIGDINVETKSYDIDQKEKLAVPGAVKVPAGTLLISTVRPTRGAITITRTSLFVSSAFCRLCPKNGLLFHVVCSQDFLSYLGENSFGGTYPTCRDETILGYEKVLPSDPREQTAIARVLSDMDAELTALEARRDKTLALKQGMMQALLTGRIRLVAGN